MERMSKAFQNFKDDMAKRPDRTSMEGMIWNANHVLDVALDPKTPGVPRQLLADCKGVILISVVEAGFIFSGNVGTGVVFAQDDKGKWSPPSAIGMTGIGFGLLIGAEVKDIMILLIDERSIESVSGEHHIKFGSQLGLAAGPLGRELGGDLNMSLERSDIALSYSFSKGLFAGINLEGAVLGARSKVNKTFYGKEVKPKEILFNRNVTVPENCGIEELHQKLDLIKAGKTSELSDADKEKIEKMRIAAEEAGKAAKENHGDDIVYVDAKEEAAKEKKEKESDLEEQVKDNLKIDEGEAANDEAAAEAEKAATKKETESE